MGGWKRNRIFSDFLLSLNKPIIMLLREKVQEQIALLPEKFSLDELVEKLILIEKIQKGIHQSENDEVTSDEDLDREISKW